MKERILHLFVVFLIAPAMAAQCTVDLPLDTVTVYFGYEPLACAPLSATASGSDPISLDWNTGDTTSSIIVCDTVSTWYFVTASDGDGCSATDSVFVNVVDVRCGNNNNKVLVCHIPPGNPANEHTICISSNGIPAHLAHGCVLGPCTEPVDSLQTGEELQILISPNPMSDRASVSVTSTIDQRVTISGVDATGRIVSLIFEGELQANGSRTLYLENTDLPERTRMVWIRVQAASGTVVQRALVIGD